MVGDRYDIKKLQEWLTIIRTCPTHTIRIRLADKPNTWIVEVVPRPTGEPPGRPR